MKRLAFLLLLPSLAAAQTIGAGVTIGSGVAVGAPFVATAPPSGIIFTPSAQHFSGTISPTITYPTNTSADIFYTTNGYPASPASTLYSSALSLTTTTTVNAIAYLPGTVRQGSDRSTTGWKTVFDSTNTLASITGNCPNKQIGGGVAGVITDCEFDTTALSNTAVHLDFTSTAAGTGQRQVLWTMSGGSCDDCTEYTQSFDIEPAESQSNVWAYENDMQLWDATRHLELTCGLQCLQGNGSNIWEVSGQSGWTSSGASCSLSGTAFTHVEAHCHRIINDLACNWTGKTSSAITTTTQTTFTVTQRITPGMVLTIGTEQMLATAYNDSTNTVTVTRAYNGTTAATYASGVAWSAPTECIYYDTLSINGVTTTLNKTFPAAPLPQGWSGGCYNQNQLDTTHSGTVGVYIRNKNMTCGYGTQSTGSATYTKP